MIDFLQLSYIYILMNYSKWLLGLAILIVGMILIKIIYKLVGKIFDKTEFERTLEIFIHRAIGVFLWIILLIVILANLGVNVTGLIAGLGVAGLIIGMATQNALSNLTSGLFLLFAQPLKVGETVEVLSLKGKVYEINMTTTVLFTQDNEYISLPNLKVWNSPIKNFSRFKEIPINQ